MFRLQKSRNTTLRRQIVSLLIWFFVAIIVMQCFFFAVYFSTSEHNYSFILRSNTEQLAQTANVLGTRLQEISNLITYNYNTARLFGSESLRTKLQLLRSLDLTIDSVRSSYSAIHAVVLTDFGQLCFGDCTDTVFRILPKIQAAIIAAHMTPKRELLQTEITDPTTRALRFVRVVFIPSSPPASVDFYTIIVFDSSPLKKTLMSKSQTTGTYDLFYDQMSQVAPVNARSATITPFTLQAAGVSNTLGFHRLPNRILFVQPVRRLGWTIVGSLPTSVIWDNVVPVLLPNLIMVIFFMTLLLFEGWLLIRNITAPISYMAHFMQSVGNSDHRERLEVRGQNELGLLSCDINSMLDKMEAMADKEAESRKRLYRALIEKQAAELSSFQSQVNPHFLYNTLDCVRSMALTQDRPEIAEIAAAMVHIFRYSVKERDRVQLRDELDCIRKYLLIIQIRQSDRFVIRYDFEERALSAQIPKMVLQPLVENAVMHGLEPIRGPGALTLRASAKGDMLDLEVEDSGIGMSDDTLCHLREMLASSLSQPNENLPSEYHSIGLLNIDRRLKLTYGESFGLQLFHSPHGGVLARITVPFVSATSAQAASCRSL